ncbi:MAG: acyl-ACP--UDP-N-acetylglucosamine O-acyltransferase [Gammaproteobacteria bacterium]|nr:acyl-ACP--UDP-N-acetylglucosamine O-acyltransferase [Gammaproteobacteria bacterium]MDH5778024.1 acyl-ACP--UDP-N-acetylglucosamine O-acyltransferase [Gammaproteobacteria bacterium]
MSLHPTAVIDSSAKIDSSVTIGPYSVIGPNVEIGADTWIGPHVVINGPTKIGKENQIFQFSSIGEVPQDKKFHGENSLLEIGDGNTIREFVTINRGTEDGGGITRVGDDNWLMAYIHIAHDCIVGSHTIFANCATLAGHVVIQDYAILGGSTLVHQFCTVGKHAFCGMGSAISKDVPPFVMVGGNPSEPHGLNREGIKRHGFSKEVRENLDEAYKLTYNSGLKAKEAAEKIAELAQSTPELAPFVELINTSTRGIIRPKTNKHK